MRVRTEEKRREIVRAAASLFEQAGYERTSMAMIAERMRGSKQTLYNYFDSKEDLLRAVIDSDVGEVTNQAMKAFTSEKSLRKALIRVGSAYLERRLAPLAIANMRMAANQPDDSKFGEDFYENVLRPAWSRVADTFTALMKEGKLRHADPWIAAMHWRGLIELDLFERRLLGAIPMPDPKELESAATCAADAFLKIYGPDQPAAKT